MADITTRDLIDLFTALDTAIQADKDRLCQLDGVIGDADHGITMAMGFSAITEALRKLDPAVADPATVFNTAAKSFLSAVGASSGPLYATAFMRAASAVKGCVRLDQAAMVAAVAAMARGIQERGKGERGDKTMLDAWIPAAAALEAASAEGQDLKACFAAAVDAAAAGAEATKTMVANKGRASRLGERALGHMDPGAASAVTILSTMAAWSPSPGATGRETNT